MTHDNVVILCHNHLWAPLGLVMIKITGSHELEATREKVWPRIFDPISLMGLIPGCQLLERIGVDQYSGQIQIGLAGVSGLYDMSVRVVDQAPPAYCRFEGEVSGSAGRINGQALFQLKEVKENSQINYEAQAMITGALAKLSPRFIEGTIQALIKLGMASLNRQLRAQLVDNAKERSKI